MDTVVFVLQILMWILCPAVIGLILLQGAAGDISSAFGGGGQLDASLGVGAHRKMAQVTGALAVIFFVTVLILAYPHRGSFRDVKGVPAVVPAAPAAPAMPAAPIPEAPKVEVPAAPAPEAPNAEVPVAPAPAVEAKIEAPVPPVAAPAPEAPKAEAPAPAPAAEAPKAEAAPAPAPAAEAPAKP